MFAVAKTQSQNKGAKILDIIIKLYLMSGLDKNRPIMLNAILRCHLLYRFID